MQMKLRRGAVALAGVVLAQTALADFKVVERDGYRVDAQLEIQAGAFQGDNPWFGEDEAFVGADVENWTEQAIEFGLRSEADMLGGKLTGEWSGVFTRTYGDDASGLGIGTDDPSRYHTEQAYISWQSGEGFVGQGEDSLTLKAGRFDYSIGSGLLIADGGGDGGNRGGWWIGARKAYSDSFLASLDRGSLLLEGFYLKNQPRNGGATGKVYGTNIEYEFESAGVTLGGTILRVEDRGSTVFPDFDTISLRAAWETPLNGLSFDGEVVEQTDDSEGEAFWVSSTYKFEEVSWSPELSYRFAHLSGDDPDTADDERFRPLAYGFTDYGSWYQGEITGNYPLENSNLDSHMLRLLLTPTEDVTVNLIYFNFTLDEEQIFGDPVTDDDFGDEINLSVDWAVNDNLFVIVTLGLLSPGDAAESWTGGDEDWVYSMVYASYTF